MSSFPLRKEKSFFADVLLRHNNYDLFLFIEDEKMPHVYKKLISRMFNNEINIGKIYSLKSKKNVLDKFHHWKESANSLNKCVFIVDKDFDHFKGKVVPNNSNLIELEYYTIENYLISKEGVVALLHSKIFNKEEEEIIQLLDWENWLINIYSSLKRLFIVYAIANKYDLKKNCSISPYRYLKKNTFEINIEETENYINEIKLICDGRADFNFEEEYSEIDKYFYKNNTYKYEEMIKGKYLYAALFKYLHHLSGELIDEDLGSLIIADNVLLDNLNFMKTKLLAI